MKFAAIDRVLGEHWDSQKYIMDAIREEGITSYVARYSDAIAEVFTLNDRACRCIDEGTPGGVHLAGSGILLDKLKACKILSDASCDGIYSHEGCGAAALAGMDAIEWAKQLAEVAELPYLGHIDSSSMRRPSFHNARITYYDGTGSFDYSATNKLPGGFIISRKYLDIEYALKELEISISIAFGDHGFGELFCLKDPFLVVAVADDEAQLEILKNEIASSVSKIECPVAVDGFCRVR